MVTGGQDSSEGGGWTAGRLRTLLDSCPLGVQECDTSGVITFSNAAHAEMHGYAPGELRGRTIYSLLDSPSAREDLATYLAYLVAEQPPPTPYTSKGLTKDGQVIDVQVDWGYLRDAQGAVIGFASIIDDVTVQEQKRTKLEDRVAGTKMRFQSVFESARDGIIIVDVLGRVLEANATSERLCGFEKHEQRDVTLNDLFHTADSARIADQYTKLLEGPRDCQPLEFRASTLDGDELWLQTSLSAARDESGSLAFGLLIIRDITELKRAQERQVTMTRELEHRVKNNLTTILALFNLTSADAQTLDELSNSFRGRVQAMARSHHELVQRSWHGLTIDEVLNVSLPSFSARNQCISTEGARIMLPPKIALPFALAVHELAALSAADGKVHVSWRARANGGVCIEWVDRGENAEEIAELPPGLGLRLIRVLVEHEIGGEVELEAGAGQLKWSVMLPKAAFRR